MSPQAPKWSRHSSRHKKQVVCVSDWLSSRSTLVFSLVAVRAAVTRRPRRYPLNVCSSASSVLRRRIPPQRSTWAPQPLDWPSCGQKRTSRWTRYCYQVPGRAAWPVWLKGRSKRLDQISPPRRSIPFHSIPFHSIPFHSTPSSWSIVRHFATCFALRPCTAEWNGMEFGMEWNELWTTRVGVTCVVV
jgi:hypothetical protein